MISYSTLYHFITDIIIEFIYLYICMYIYMQI